MTTKFLRAKPWQLFLLVFGLPMIIHFIIVEDLLAIIEDQANFDTSLMGIYMEYFPVVMFIFMGVFLSWVWSMAMGLQRQVPHDVRLKVRKFKIFFFIPVVYLTLVVLFLDGVIDYFMQAGGDANMNFLGWLIVVMVPLHLLSVFGVLYSFYFAAKTLRTVELQREVHFSDFAGEFFLIWFYPIGIWVLQPKLNKMAGEGPSNMLV